MADVYDREGNRLLTATEAAESVNLDRESFMKRVSRGTAPKPVLRISNIMFFLENDVQSWARWRGPRG